MKYIEFIRATTREERQALNIFLNRHNRRGQGSTTGYMAYYAAISSPDGRPLQERVLAVAKFCPLHTPRAARFFGGDEEWRHVYCLQRLAACNAPDNLLSQFGGWCLREMGRDEKVHFVATYAATDDFDERTGKPNDGTIYRALNAVYCGKTKGGRIEGFVHNGQRYSMRCGPKTRTKKDIPPGARILRAGPMHRYCWAVAPTPLKRFFRRRALQQRMVGYKFVAVYQPRLFVQLLAETIGEIISAMRLLWPSKVNTPQIEA